MRTTVVSSGLITTQMPTAVTAALRQGGAGRNAPAEREAAAGSGDRAEEGAATECQSVAHDAAPYALPPSDAAVWIASRMRW